MMVEVMTSSGGRRFYNNNGGGDGLAGGYSGGPSAAFFLLVSTGSDEGSREGTLGIENSSNYRLGMEFSGGHNEWW